MPYFASRMTTMSRPVPSNREPVLLVTTPSHAVRLRENREAQAELTMLLSAPASPPRPSSAAPSVMQPAEGIRGDGQAGETSRRLKHAHVAWRGRSYLAAGWTAGQKVSVVGDRGRCRPPASPPACLPSGTRRCSLGGHRRAVSAARPLADGCRDAVVGHCKAPKEIVAAI